MMMKHFCENPAKLYTVVLATCLFSVVLSAQWNQEAAVVPSTVLAVISLLSQVAVGVWEGQREQAVVESSVS